MDILKQNEVEKKPISQKNLMLMCINRDLTLFCDIYDENLSCFFKRKILIKIDSWLPQSHSPCYSAIRRSVYQKAPIAFAEFGWVFPPRSLPQQITSILFCYFYHVPDQAQSNGVFLWYLTWRSECRALAVSSVIWLCPTLAPLLLGDLLQLSLFQPAGYPMRLWPC